MQTLRVLVGFGAKGRERRIFCVLPELIFFRHGQLFVPDIPMYACAPWQERSEQNSPQIDNSAPKKSPSAGLWGAGGAGAFLIFETQTRPVIARIMSPSKLGSFSYQKRKKPSFAASGCRLWDRLVHFSKEGLGFHSAAAIVVVGWRHFRGRCQVASGPTVGRALCATAEAHFINPTTAK
jgi:hypothetical protein